MLGRKEGKGSTEGELSDGKKGNPFGDSGKKCYNQGFKEQVNVKSVYFQNKSLEEGEVQFSKLLSTGI